MSSAALTLKLMTYLPVHWQAMRPLLWGWWHCCLLTIDELCSSNPEVDDLPGCPFTSSADPILRLMTYLAVYWRALHPLLWGWWRSCLSNDQLCSPDPEVDDLPGCPLTSSAALTLRLMTYLAVHWRALQPWPWGWWRSWLSINELWSPDPEDDDLPGCPLTSSAALTLRLMTPLDEVSRSRSTGLSIRSSPVFTSSGWTISQ